MSHKKKDYYNKDMHLPTIDFQGTFVRFPGSIFVVEFLQVEHIYADMRKSNWCRLVGSSSPKFQGESFPKKYVKSLHSYATLNHTKPTSGIVLGDDKSNPTSL